MAMQVKIRQEPETRAEQWVRSQSGSRPRGRRAAHAAAPSDGPYVRTCTHCGARGAFRIDPLGCWSECPLCGHLS